MRALPNVLLLSALSALSACGEPVVISDNIVTEFVGAQRVDELAPLLDEGAVFVLTADRRGRRDNMNAWQIVSSDPSVLSLTPVPPDPEIDDAGVAADPDCDGLDGEIEAAVFVSARSGDDLADGRATTPVARPSSTTMRSTVVCTYTLPPCSTASTALATQRRVP